MATPPSTTAEAGPTARSTATGTSAVPAERSGWAQRERIEAQRKRKKKDKERKRDQESGTINKRHDSGADKKENKEDTIPIDVTLTVVRIVVMKIMLFFYIL